MELPFPILHWLALAGVVIFIVTWSHSRRGPRA
jgi:hypothetical protein